ncbi:MAG: DUF3291 domain-containing protein [Ktedonobacteraceae bacterium]
MRQLIWVPQGHIPTVEEGKERLEYLHDHEKSTYVFSLKKPFPPADTTNVPISPIHEECPA